jgi:tetratricopeptide (TPR) repeat protein
MKTRWIVSLIALVIFLVLGGVSVALLTSAKIQKSFFSKAPNYTAPELYSRAVEQVVKGDYKQAEAYLTQALQTQDDSTYRNQLAVVEYQLKKYPESIAQYQLLVTTHHDEAFAWNGMGNAYRDWAASDATKKVEYEAKAISAYTSSKTVDPTYVAAYSNLAQLLDSEAKKAEALQILDEGIAHTNQPELVGLKTVLQANN